MSKEIPEELLHIKSYPEQMFMDIYGNGHSAWDQKNHRNIDDVEFRCEYIRKDKYDVIKNALDSACKYIESK